MAVENFEMIIKAVDEASKELKRIQKAVDDLQKQGDKGVKIPIEVDEKGIGKQFGVLENLVGNFGDAFKSAGTAAGSALTSVTSTLGTMLSPLNLVIVAFAPLIGIAKIFLQMLNPINLVKTALSAASAVVSTFVNVASAGFGLIKSVISASFNAIISIFNTFKSAVTSIISLVGTLFNTFSKFTVTLAAAIQIIKDVAGAFIAMGKAAFEAFSYIVGVSADFEQSMSGVAAVTNANAEEMQKLRDAALEMGRTTSKTAKESADALYLLGQSGLNADESIHALVGTVKLAEASNASLNDTTELVVGTMKAYKMSMSDSQKVANIFAAGISSSRLTVERLKLSLKYVAPIAKELGIPLEELVGITGALADRNIYAGQAGTSLRKALVSLINETDKGTAALKKYGLTYDDINLNTKTFTQVIGTLRKAFSKTGDKVQATGDLVKIFGFRAGPTMATLLGTGEKALDKYTTNVTGTNEAFKQAKVRLDNLRGSMTLFTSAIEGVITKLGTPFQKSFTTIVRLTTDVVRAFDNFVKRTGLIETATNLITTSTEFYTTVLKKMGEILATAKPSLDLFAYGITTISNAFSKSLEYITNFIRENEKISSIITVVSGVITSMSERATTDFRKIIDVVFDFTDELLGLSYGFASLSENIAGKIGAIVLSFATWVISGKAIEDMLAAITTIGLGFNNFVKAFSELITVATGYMMDFSSGTEGFSTIVKTAGEIGKAAFDLMADSIRKAILVHDLIVAVIPLINAAYVKTKGIITSVTKVIYNLIKAYSSFVKLTSKGISIDFAGALKKAYDSALSVVKTKSVKLLKYIETSFDNLDTSKVTNSLNTFFTATFNSLASSFQGGSNALEPAILSIFDFFDELADKLSPKIDKFASELFFEFNYFMYANAEIAGQAMGETLSLLIDYFNIALDFVVDGMIGLLEGRKSGAGSPSQIMADFFGAIWEEVQPGLEYAFQSILSFFTVGWNLLIDSISKLVGGSGVSTELVASLKKAFETGNYDVIRTTIGDTLMRAINTALSVGLELVFKGFAFLIETVWNNLGTTAAIIAKIGALMTTITVGLSAIKAIALLGTTLIKLIGIGIGEAILASKWLAATTALIKSFGIWIATTAVPSMASIIATKGTFAAVALAFTKAVGTALIVAFVGWKIGKMIGTYIESYFSEGFRDGLSSFLTFVPKMLGLVTTDISKETKKSVDENKKFVAEKWGTLYDDDVAKAILDGEKISDVLFSFGIKTKRAVDESTKNLEEMPKKINKIGEDTGVALENVGKQFDKLPIKINESTEKTKESLRKFDETINPSKSPIQKAVDESEKAWARYVKATANGIKTYENVFVDGKEVLQAVWHDPDTLTSAEEGGKNVSTAYFRNLKQTALDKQSEVGETMRDVVVGVLNQASVAVEKAKDIGALTIQNQIQGILSEMDSLEVAMTRTTENGMLIPLDKAQLQMLADNKAKLAKLVEQLAALSGPVKEATKQGMKGLPEEVEKAGDEAKQKAEDVGVKTAKALADGIKKGAPEVEAAMDIAKKSIDDKGIEIKQNANKLGNDIADKLSQGIAVHLRKDPIIWNQGMRDAFEVEIELAKKSGAQFGTDFSRSIVASVESSKYRIQKALGLSTMFDKSSEIGKLGAYGLAVGKSYGENLAQGLKNSRELVSNALDTITPILKGQSPPKEGPLKDMGKWGENVGESYVQGMGNSLSDVASVISSLNLGDAIQSAMSSGVNLQNLINTGFDPSKIKDSTKIETDQAGQLARMMKMATEGILKPGQAQERTSTMEKFLGSDKQNRLLSDKQNRLLSEQFAGARNIGRMDYTTPPPSLNIPGSSGSNNNQTGNINVDFSGNMVINEPMDAEKVGNIVGNQINDKLNKQRQRGYVSKRSTSFTR